MGCFQSARYVYYADILRKGSGDSDKVDLSEEGHWVSEQDPESWAVVDRWVPVEDNTDSSDVKVWSVPCLVHGIIDGGIRVSGTSESFERDYQNVDYARMFFPANVVLTQRDRVTNIRNKRTGHVLWVDEEVSRVDGKFRSTVFNIEGVTPIADPFGKHIENYASLKKAEGYAS